MNADELCFKDLCVCFFIILNELLMLPNNKKRQISKNLSLSHLVEPRGVKSNYFGEDISVFKTCNLNHDCQ